MKFRFLTVFTAVSILSGCVPRTLTVRATAKVLDHGVAAVYEETDPVFAKDSMPGQLKLMEVLLRSDPRNSRLLKSLAEGYFGYAFLFLQEDEPDRAAALYRRSAAYALRLLGRDSKWTGLSDMPREKMAAALKTASRGDVPGLYWTANAWAGWANLEKSDTSALAVVPKAVRIMKRVLELDPDFQFGGPDLFFGIYYASRPRMAGGDPEKGKAHFESALNRTKRRFLMAHLLYAEYYTVAVLKEEQFKSLIAEIRDAPGDLLPEAALINAVTKLKSEKLLERFDDLF